MVSCPRPCPCSWSTCSAALHPGTCSDPQCSPAAPHATRSRPTRPQWDTSRHGNHIAVPPSRFRDWQASCDRIDGSTSSRCTRSCHRRYCRGRCDTGPVSLGLHSSQWKSQARATKQPRNERLTEHRPRWPGQGRQAGSERVEPARLLFPRFLRNVLHLGRANWWRG